MKLHRRDLSHTMQDVPRKSKRRFAALEAGDEGAMKFMRKWGWDKAAV